MNTFVAAILKRAFVSAKNIHQEGKVHIHQIKIIGYI